MFGSLSSEIRSTGAVERVARLEWSRSISDARVVGSGRARLNVRRHDRPIRLRRALIGAPSKVHCAAGCHTATENIPRSHAILAGREHYLPNSLAGRVFIPDDDSPTNL